jgi:hypothetical protein
MDPITTVIVAALPAMASELAKSAVKDTYGALKSMIRRKWGNEGSVAKAVDALEANPNSRPQAQTLAEQVAAVNGTKDAEVMRAVAKLADELKKKGIGGEAVARIAINISGGNVQGVVGAENTSIGSMTFEAPGTGKKP